MFYWASKSANSVEKGVFFFVQNLQKGGVFQTWVRAWYTLWLRVERPASLRGQLVNSLAPGRFDYSLKLVNLKLISTINISSNFCETAIR